jgi:hypothetical protein
MGTLHIGKPAQDQAQYYLSRAREYRLDVMVRYQLEQVAHCYTGRRNEAAARAGLEWMREQARRRGERVTF